MAVRVQPNQTLHIRFKWPDPKRVTNNYGKSEIAHKVDVWDGAAWNQDILYASDKLHEAIEACGGGPKSIVAVTRTGEGTATRWSAELYKTEDHYMPGFEVQGDTAAPQAAPAAPAGPPAASGPPAGNAGPPASSGPPAANTDGGDLMALTTNLLVCKMYVEKYFDDETTGNVDLVQKYATTLYIEGNRKGVDFRAARDKLAGGMVADVAEKVAQTFDAVPIPTEPPDMPTTGADSDLPF